MQVSRTPLLIDDLSLATDIKVKRGAVYRRNFKIKHIGATDEIILNFWLEITEPKSEPLLGWCAFEPNPPLTIRRGEFSDTITLSFEVPPLAQPDLYNYVIVCQSIQDPRKHLRHPLQLQVTASETDLELDMDPGFSLDPVTTSTTPQVLQAGETLQLVVNVENRSKLTDRFYLTCPELPKEWFTVHYPKSAIERLGLIQEIDGLQLNPKSQGEISLLLHPPQYTAAGNYFPTLQLTSRNNKNLVLLDVAYLQILPDQRLAPQLAPALRRIPEEPGAFELQLINLGNIKRQITIRGSDQNNLFKYRLQPASIELDPGDSQQIPLTVKPRKWWRRPWRGDELKFNFELEFENTRHPDLPTLKYPPALPETPPQGKIIWQPRPWWQRGLLGLLILAPLAAIVGLAIFLWLNRPRPPELPTITAFAPFNIKQGYQEGRSEPIRLNWQVSHLQRIDRLTVIRLEKGVETDRKSYFFNGMIPNHLQRKTLDKNFCEETPLQTHNNGYSLKLGAYSFYSLKIPYPYIHKQIETSSHLVCKGIITSTKKAGDYTFQMQVFQRPNDAQKQRSTTQTNDPIASRSTDTITIESTDPQILNFAPTRLLYQEPDPVADAEDFPSEGIVRLNWGISNPDRLAALKLRSISPAGAAQGELRQYPIIHQTLPPELQDYCTIGTHLICQNVPTDARQPGDYLFKLTAVIRQEQGTTESTQATAPIKIQPFPLKIVSFTVNGEEVSQKPRQAYLLSQWIDAVQVILSWTVEGGESTQVELLPAPGLVPMQGAMNLSLRGSNTTTVTLKVSNKYGGQTSQSVDIQTVEAQAVIQPSFEFDDLSAPSQSNQPGASSENGEPPPPDRLEPIELPPQPN